MHRRGITFADACARTTPRRYVMETGKLFVLMGALLSAAFIGAAFLSAAL